MNINILSQRLLTIWEFEYSFICRVDDFSLMNEFTFHCTKNWTADDNEGNVNVILVRRSKKFKTIIIGDKLDNPSWILILLIEYWYIGQHKCIMSQRVRVIALYKQVLIYVFSTKNIKTILWFNVIVLPVVMKQISKFNWFFPTFILVAISREGLSRWTWEVSLEVP